jgi:hypothetical protein
VRNLFPLSGKVYALEVMVEKRNQFDMSYSKRDGGKGELSSLRSQLEYWNTGIMASGS